MEQVKEVCADDYYDICDFLEDVYGSAYWALEAGATKGDLIDQIDHAFDCLQEMKKDGLLGGHSTKGKDGEAPA